MVRLFPSQSYKTFSIVFSSAMRANDPSSRLSLKIILDLPTHDTQVRVHPHYFP